MKRYLPKNAEAASALVLTLLVIMLLSATVVSFIWTTRTEMQATRNYSAKVRAEQFATSATEQAMAKIQQGFNTTGNGTGNFTSVLTTQPGAITKYFFSNGTLQTNSTITTELFSSGSGNVTSNGTVNLNNLENPGNSTSNATSNQWTITGNASERINVFMENVTTTVNGANQTVGRIAYYVDDEGSKLNLNAATGNRTTLNVGSSRSLSLSTLTNSTQSANFTAVVNGNASSNSTTNIKNWAHFFRPEQVGGAVSGFDPNNIPKLSAAPTTGMDYHTKKTPWGTDRLFINDLPIDSTANATASVNAIYEALSGKNATTMNASTANASAYELIGQGLRNIYGTTFAEKYTDVGLKQIAANILQARHADILNDPTKSFGYNGSLLGATDLSFPSNSQPRLGLYAGQPLPQYYIPKDYLGTIPYPILNEIGVTVTVGFVDKQWLFLLIRPFVSIFNPWPVTFPSSAVANWKIEMQIDSFTYEIEHDKPGEYGPQINKYGPSGYKNAQPFGRDGNKETDAVFAYLNSGRSTTKHALESSLSSMSGRIYYMMNGQAMIGRGYGNIFNSTHNALSYKQDLAPGEELQFPCPPHIDLKSNGNDLYNKSGGVRMLVPAGVRILDIFNIQIKFEYIRLLAVAESNPDPPGGLAPEAKTIRDFMIGVDVPIECSLQKPINKVAVDWWQVRSVSWPKGYPEVPSSDPVVSSNNKKVMPTIDQIKPPEKSIKRIGGALKPSVNTLPTPTPSPAPSPAPSPTLSPRPSMLAWSVSSNATWVSSNASGNVSSTSTTGNAEAYPSTTQSNEIPGDPTKTDSDIRYAFDPAEHHLDSNDWPKIEFTNPANSTGVFTSPADLGKIQTNIQHRKLRFTTQHPNEIHRDHGGNGNATKSDGSQLSYIPDWAMLDVISFGSNASNATTVRLPAPLNLNGRFHLPSATTNNSTQPAARTAGLEAALKALDSATLLGNSFNASFTPPTDRSQYMGSSGNVSSTVAGNIGNLTWSTGNFTTSNSTGNATWGKGNSTSDPGSRRKTAKFPTNQFVLPSEVTEIRGVSDVVPLDNYTSNSTHIKANEGRLSSLFPGATTQSRFFTIYAFAQAGQLQNKNQPESATNPFIPDSEVVTKTLVEVEAATVTSSGTTTPTPTPTPSSTPTPPPTYKVKKLYSQQIISQ